MINLTREEKIKTNDMRKSGLTYTEIAHKLNISRNTVSSYCRRNNLGANRLISTKNCKNCGKAIKTVKGKKTKKFCCDKCRVNWWNNHQNEVLKKAIYNFNCINCNKEFTAYGNKNRKYCSHRCYISSRYNKENNI